MLDNSQSPFYVPRIGCDLVDLRRFESLLARADQAFIKKIFTLKEQSFFPPVGSVKRSRYIAKRFAAKEAFAKSIGTGFGAALKFHDIEVLSRETGQPYIEVSLEIQKTHHIQSISLSLSDEKLYGMAFCIVI